MACVALIVLAVIGWRSTMSDAPPRLPAAGSAQPARADDTTASGSPPGPGRRAALDVAAFRGQVRRLLERGKELAARGAKPPRSDGSAARPPTPKTQLADMLAPCILGPADLCALLGDLVAECDTGDAQTCLAIGQLLADTPPRPLIASAFFAWACKAGEQTACERLEATKHGSGAPCEDDPFVCGWLAYRSKDPAALEQACALGVGDACTGLFILDEAGPRARGYLENACQLGVPMACEELGRRLSPECAPTPDRGCFPPDPAEARAALEIACAAGWQAACLDTP